MKRKLIMFILEILSLLLFSEDYLKLQRVSYFEPGAELYVEAVYELDEDIYVSDELNSGISYFSLNGNCLNLSYYPRGNKIQCADESTFWPAPVRKISNGDILTFRCNLKDAIRDGNPYDTELITEVKFVIREICFKQNEHIKENRLCPQAYKTKFNIKSKEILFQKDEIYYRILNDSSGTLKSGLEEGSYE